MTKYIVGFTTKLIDGFAPNVDSFEPPANYKSADAIAGWREKKAISLTAAASQQPYTAEFASIVLCNLADKKILKWTVKTQAEGLSSPAHSVRNYLLKLHPKTWDNTLTGSRVAPPDVIFIGFDTKLFLKILGIECSLPTATGESLRMPLSFWYGNSDHRDIGDAVRPTDYSMSLDWPTVLKRRGLDQYITTWTVPHIDAMLDVQLATELATQIGVLDV